MDNIMESVSHIEAIVIVDDSGLDDNITNVNVHVDESACIDEGTNEVLIGSIVPSDEVDIGTVEKCNYEIKQASVKQLSCQPSKAPNLCSHSPYLGQILPTESGNPTPDKLKKESGTDLFDSYSSEYEVEKRKPKIVAINKGRTNLTRIETVKYKYQGEKFRQHYVKELKEKEKDICGDIGLRPKDLLLSLNDESLENIKQKKVLKMFKLIKPQLEDGTIKLILTFRRWEHEEGGQKEFEVDYKLTLTLEPDDGSEPRGETTRHIKLKRHRSFRAIKDLEELSKSPVPPGQIDDVEVLGEEKGRLRVVHGGPDEYITAGDDGQVLIEVPTNKERSRFIFEKYKADDRAPESYPLVFLRRICFSTPETKLYLTSNVRNEEYGLKFEESRVTTANFKQPGNVDESFFILREYGNEILFESLLFRGYYVSCNRGDRNQDSPPTLCMVKKSESDVEHEKNVQSCLFEYFRDADVQSGRQRRPLEMFFDTIFGCIR